MPSSCSFWTDAQAPCLGDRTKYDKHAATTKLSSERHLAPFPVGIRESFRGLFGDNAFQLIGRQATDLT